MSIIQTIKQDYQRQEQEHERSRAAENQRRIDFITDKLDAMFGEDRYSLTPAVLGFQVVGTPIIVYVKVSSEPGAYRLYAYRMVDTPREGIKLESPHHRIDRAADFYQLIRDEDV